MDYEKYEIECERIRKENDEYLDLFKKDLELQGLAISTIKHHLYNMDFYINSYLLREDAYSMEQGITRIDDFLGFFFIRKCAWSTPGNIKTYATSIKKFYKSMLDHGKIKKDDYKDLCDEIKELMPFWQSTCADYNNPYADNPFDDLMGFD